MNVSLDVLVGVLVDERHRLSERLPDTFPLHIVSDADGSVICGVAPSRGASESELQAAEKVLNRHYPFELRELLAFTNGWPDAGAGLDILGTKGVGIRPGIPGYPSTYPETTWGLARESLEVMFDEAQNMLTEQLEIDDCIPVTASPVTGDFHFIVSEAPGRDISGRVYAFEQGTLEPVGSVSDLIVQIIDTVKNL
ncbi:hypothetical protein MTP03_32900 [Tsukamurella sp. PLM1]|nr:hypothetical protein MTP03_32900 [Tsukamurella sp. PLM1]